MPMTPKVSIPHYLTIYRLGTLYANYRLIIALSLTLIFFITIENQGLQYEYPNLYFYALMFYVGSSLAQLLLLKYFQHAISAQIVGLFAVDLVFLSSLTFALGGPNISIGLLFVISVFASNFLLSKHQALFMTLVAVICVVYQQFVGSLFNHTDLNNIGNSVFLAFLFFVVYGLGQFSIQRFQLLESLTTYQSNELFKFQNINRYILEQIEVGYLVLDENCKIIVSNPAACTLLGISPLYAHEQFHLATFQPDLFHILKRSLLADGERFQFESPQSTYVVDVRVQNLIVPQQALTLLILEDAQKLNQKVQQLKLAALGQLSASIAHEIRNPLAAIVQANELNQDSDQAQRELLGQMIAKQAKRIDTIIQDTLAMAKNKKTQTIRIHLLSFIQDLIQNDLSDVAQQIQFEIPASFHLCFDESQLRQVLINLIRNAIRHNAKDAEFILIQAQRQNDIIQIDVIDFGQGIDQADIAQLFKPFFSTEINGTGLGLYLSQSMCEANQAKLSYIQQKQQGACFRMECAFLD
ncbi:sensor histidine kinase [Acinetobacter lanii]